MKKITRIIRPIICMAVLLFAMTTAVMGCYQKETEPIDIPGRTPSGTSAPQPSATPAGEVIPSVDRQAELAEARAKNPDTGHRSGYHGPLAGVPGAHGQFQDEEEVLQEQKGHP